MSLGACQQMHEQGGMACNAYLCLMGRRSCLQGGSKVRQGSPLVRRALGALADLLPRAPPRLPPAAPPPSPPPASRAHSFSC